MMSLIEGELIAENHGLNFIYFVSIIKIKQRSGRIFISEGDEQ